MLVRAQSLNKGERLKITIQRLEMKLRSKKPIT